jgi:hypothetical protein
MIDDDECEAVGGMIIGRGNRSTQKNPAAVPFCTLQISHDFAWDRTWAATVGSWPELRHGMSNKSNFFLSFRVQSMNECRRTCDGI